MPIFVVFLVFGVENLPILSQDELLSADAEFFIFFLEHLLFLVASQGVGKDVDLLDEVKDDHKNLKPFDELKHESS